VKPRIHHPQEREVRGPLSSAASVRWHGFSPAVAGSSRAVGQPGRHQSQGQSAGAEKRPRAFARAEQRPAFAPLGALKGDGPWAIAIAAARGAADTTKRQHERPLIAW